MPLSPNFSFPDLLTPPPLPASLSGPPGNFSQALSAGVSEQAAGLHLRLFLPRFWAVKPAEAGRFR